MRLGRRQLTHDGDGGGGGGDGQRDATIDDGGLAPGRTQKVEATIDGPRPQQQAKDTLSAKEKRAQTGAGGQVLAVARLTSTQARSCWARPNSTYYSH